MSALASAVIRLKHGFAMLRKDPPAFFRRVSAEVKGPFRRGVVRKTMRGVVCEFDFGFDAAIKLMVDEIYEPDMVRTMESILKPGDTFIDVGANIGYISAVGLGLVGPSGSVHSFEPVPEFHSRLTRLAALNPGLAFVPNQCALGESEGRASISVSNVANIGWNTMVPGMMSKETVRESISVPVKSLGRYILDRNLTGIALMKIDTEGYEFPVLQGLRPFFESRGERPALLVEIAPSAYKLLGTKLSELSAFMSEYGYAPFDVHDHRTRIELSALTETTNVLFLSSTFNS